MAQQQALALSRSGDQEGARCILVVLSGKGHKDEETLGILGGVYLGLSDRDAGTASNWLALARASYAQAFEGASGGLALYSAINCAATAILNGDRQAARRWAKRATDYCEQQLREDSAAGRRADYWALASLGESLLIRGEEQAALACLWTIGRGCAW